MLNTHKFTGQQARMGPTGALDEDDHQLPCKRPVTDHFWKCDCFDGVTEDRGDLFPEHLIHAYLPPDASMPSMPHCPVKMSECTMISDPVLAFPVSIDYLVAAALATKRATYLRKIIRPILERSETPIVRKAAVVFDRNNVIWDNFFRTEIARQLVHVSKQPAKDLEGASDDKDDDDRARKDPWTKGERSGPYDIRTFREIHAMMHAAYNDAHDGWVLVRNDKDIWDDHEYHFHGEFCDDFEDWQPYDPTTYYGERYGCRSLDPDYWENIKDHWWERKQYPIQDVIDGDGSLIESLVREAIADESEFEDFNTEHCDWYRSIREDMAAQRRFELESWRDQLVGENGQHSWIRKNVIKVLEENFRGLKITIINATVLDEDHMRPDRARNFMPMAWVHLPTEWKKTVNPPYVEPAGPKDDSGDDDTNEEENDEDNDGEDDEEEVDGADDIACHQGYAPGIPGDPGHWYSNAARDASSGEEGKQTSKQAALLQDFVDLFGMNRWLHDLQYLPPGFENLTEGVRNSRGKFPKGSISLREKEIYHLRNKISNIGWDKEWPAVVELRKVVHGESEEEARPSSDGSSVNWNHDKGNPHSEDDSEDQENREHVSEIRQYLDSISQEVISSTDETNSCLWPDNERENAEYEEDCTMFDNIASALQTTIGKSTKTGIDPQKDLLAELQRYRTEYDARRKNLQQAAKQVEATVEETIRRAKLASKDLDRLRRKHRQDLKTLRTKKEALEKENIDLKGAKMNSTHHYKRTEKASSDSEESQGEAAHGNDSTDAENQRLRTIIRKLQREKKQSERYLSRLQVMIKKLQNEKVQAKFENRKLSVTRKRKQVGAQVDCPPGDDNNDNDNNQPPNKKQKTTGSGHIDHAKLGKGRWKTKIKSPPKPATTLQTTTKADTKQNTTAKASKSPAPSVVKHIGKHGADPGGRSGRHTKRNTESPAKPTDSTSSSTSRSPIPTPKPTKTIFKQLPTKITTSSSATTPASPPVKPQVKPGRPAKAPAKPATKPAAKTEAKTPATTKKLTATKKPAATAALITTSAPTTTAPQPTRTSRRLNNQAAEVEKVSDPEKEAKKKGKK